MSAEPGELAMSERGVAMGDARGLCSFCSSSASREKRTVVGESVQICEDCIHRCVAFLSETDGKTREALS